jgi:hypothetical protein
VYSEYVKESKINVEKLTKNKLLMDKIFDNGSHDSQAIIDSFCESLITYDAVTITKYRDLIHNLMLSDKLRYIDIMFLKDRYFYLLKCNLVKYPEQYKINKNDTDFDTCIKIVLELSVMIIFIKKINDEHLEVELNPFLSQDDRTKKLETLKSNFEGTTSELLSHVFDLEPNCLILKEIRNKQQEIIRSIL